MGKPDAYDQYIAELKEREQKLRDEIEQQSTQLENKLKYGVILGIVAMVLGTVYFVFFRRPAKKQIKAKRNARGNWVLRWVIETVSMSLIRQFWQARKAKFKDS